MLHCLPTVVVASLLASLVAAQTTTVGIALGLVVPYPIYGSVVKVDNTITSYMLECVLPSAGQSSGGFCGAWPQTPFPLIQGPNTVSMLVNSIGGGLDGIQLGCTYSSTGATTRGVCSHSGQAGYTGTTDFIQAPGITSGIFGSLIDPVTITAGVEKLPQGTAAVTTDSSASSESGSPSSGGPASTAASTNGATQTMTPSSTSSPTAISRTISAAGTAATTTSPSQGAAARSMSPLANMAVALVAVGCYPLL